MQKSKKKFIYVVISIIIAILGFEFYKTYSFVDRNSYAILLSGSGLVNEKKLVLNKKNKLKQNDKIKTLGEKSLILIKWGDGSITRLGGNSEIIIKQTDVDKNLLNIKIIFKLNFGKTWSNVISFVGGDSYFYQEFADTTAAVRGTIYEVNLEKNYVYVKEHEIKLINKNNIQIIPENKPFDIMKFSFIDLIKFINNYKDSLWEKLNVKLDKEFYTKLEKKAREINNYIDLKVEEIDNLTKEKKDKLYKEIKKTYQELNFLRPNDDLYYLKLNLKKQLIKLSDKKEKQDLLVSSFYDFNDIVKSKKYNYLKENLEIFKENLFELPKLDIDFKNYLNFDILKKIEIPKGLKNEFEKNFNSIIDTVKLDIGEINFDTNKIIDFIDYSRYNLDNFIKKSGIFEKIKELFGLKK